MSSPEVKITGDEVRDMLDVGAARLQAMAVDAAMGGLEFVSREVIPPISEAERNQLRPPEVPHVALHYALQSGPDGMMITGSHGV